MEPQGKGYRHAHRVRPQRPEAPDQLHVFEGAEHAARDPAGPLGRGDDPQGHPADLGGRVPCA